MKALLIVGSPKGKRSVSHALGSALLSRLAAGGTETEETLVADALRSSEERHRLYRLADEADLVIVSFPLYVDQLPAPLVQTLELLADRRQGAQGATPWPGPLVQRLVAIVQCGFWENHQNRPAVAIMRQFARETGFAWAGALTMGAGGALAGRSLENAGGMARNTVKTLDLAAASLAAGGNVPEEAAALMAKPLMARWLYHLAANWGFKRLIKKHGAQKRTYDRPYA
jgi:NAD(P)H-dependent FMN reductase